MGLWESWPSWLGGSRRVERLTAAAADISEDHTYDLLYLCERGVVRVKGAGQSITHIEADVENRIRKHLRVSIKPGTSFIASGSHQNMATTREQTFSLGPCEREKVRLNAACLNAARPIPGQRDRFHQVAQAHAEVARFLEAAQGADQMVIQAGLWTLTDHYTRSQIMQRLMARDAAGNLVNPISHSHCDRAMVILDRLGIRHGLRSG